MKTRTLIFTLIAMLTFAMFATTMVLAEDNSADTPMLISANTDSATNEQLNQEFNETSAGSINLEKIKNWFTFNQEKKAERELKIAKMLLVKARIEAKNNNTKAMEKSLEAHNTILDKLDNRMKNMKENSDSKIELDKVVSLERAIMVHEARIIKLNSLLQNENLTDEEIAKIEDKITKAEDVTIKLTFLQEEKIVKLKAKLVTKLNITDVEADTLVSNIQNANNFTELKAAKEEIRQELKDNREQRKSDRESRIQERQSSMQNKDNLEVSEQNQEQEQTKAGKA